LSPTPLQERAALAQAELEACSFRPDVKQSERTYPVAVRPSAPLPRGYEKVAGRLREGHVRREAVKSGLYTERGEVTRQALMDNLQRRAKREPGAAPGSGDRLYRQALERQAKQEERIQQVTLS
jgi:hypothetical protein